MSEFNWSRFRRLRGPDPRTDVDDELSFHLEMRVRELIERGESPDRARELAWQRFGDYERSRIECVEISERRRRRMVRSEHLTELRQDLGYALRTLRRSPGFTLVAVLSLALGVGATTAIFSVVHGVLLSSLPYHAAERLHEVRTLYPDGTGYSLSAPDFASVREWNQVFEQVESYSSGTFTLLGNGEPREVLGASVSDGLFDMLGFGLAAGRGFRREEFEPGQGMVALLDHGFWMREFGGDRSAIGRSVIVGGDQYTIVGVLEPDARLPNEAEMYAPLEYDDTFSATSASPQRRGEFLRVFGRAKPGVAPERITADLDRLGQQLQQQFPQTNGRLTFDAVSLREQIIGDVRTPLFVLLGAVAFVLLVACANVANLLLARTSARQEELAVRRALGAGRGRLVRQLLTESIVLGLAGGVAGLLIAWLGTRALVAAQPADIPRLDEIGVNGTVVLFTLGVSVLTGLAFGVLPALQGTSNRLMGVLREGGRGGTGGGHRVRAALVVAEMTLAVVLLTGAGLLIRSFVELTRVNPGFQPERAISFRLTFQGDEYAQGQQIRDRAGAILERLRTLPGVATAAAGSVLPLSGRGSLNDFRVGNEPPPPNVNAEIGVARVTPEYFQAIGAPMVSGRTFTEQDAPESPRVAIINEAGAKFWFGGEDPVGRTVVSGVEREIVGVVSDVLQRDPGQPAQPQLYLPWAQSTTRSLRFIVRSNGDPLALAPAIRSQVRALDPNLPLMEFVPLDDLVSESMARPRFYTALLTLFAGVALALAGTGIFGVMSYSVAQRAREISIRMALGAQASGVVRMIVSRAMVLAALGVGLGVVASVLLGSVLRSQLFGVSAGDPLTIAAVVLVLIASALLASWWPARRAAAVDPVNALRES